MNSSNRATSIILFAAVALMLGLAYASVPLYRLFCQKTGYGGTVQLATFFPDTVLDRTIKVQFVANVHRDLPWRFKPLQSEGELKLGEVGLAFYEATNLSNQPITGMATYNVTPDRAGSFFHKVHCFCFEEQTLQPGETVKMPLQYFIDPKIVDDPQLKDVKTINLNYTFFIIPKDSHRA